MKTIIKYELVINEALISALNYHTPDEQINEFIRFFGRHIGSDRIYIFEDCKERHGTDNTYEWCAQGVIPEIDRLQNVSVTLKTKFPLSSFPAVRNLYSMHILLNL